MNTPEWLSDTNNGGGDVLAQSNGASVSNPPASVTAIPVPVGASTSTNVTETDDAELPGVILMMRLANMGVAALLIVVSVC